MNHRLIHLPTFSRIACLCMVSLFVTGLATSQAVFAISQNDTNSIINNTPFYDPTACMGGTNTSGTGNINLTGNDNLQKIFNFFVSSGFTAPQAAGIVGNVMVESGGDPEISQLNQKDYQNPPLPNDPQLGWGIVQWTPASKILQYASSVSLPAYLLSTQLQFLLAQLNGTTNIYSEKHAGDMLKQVTTGIVAGGVQESTAWHASQVFLEYYERAADSAPNGPNAQLRGKYANAALAKYGASSPSGATDTFSASCNSTGSGGGVAGQCDAPAPTSGYAAVKAALSAKFKINLVGDPDNNWATQEYNTMCALAKAPAFFSRLMAAGPITVNLHAGGCSGGHASAVSGVDMYGFCDKDYNRGLFVHELGHMFSFRNPSVYQEFNNQVWGHSPVLPTFNCNYDYGIGPFEAECWADMIGEYLVWFDIRFMAFGKPPGTHDFKQFQSQYPVYYNFARDKLFGGVQYTSF